MQNNYSIIITTSPDKETAKKTAKLLIEKHLAACAQIFPVESIYIWQGKICDDDEFLIFIKSKTALFEKIAAEIKENHPYDVPEIIQIPIINGTPEYLKWIDDSTSLKKA
ncbi:MAG: divalent-cation tolerance protein CutA [Oscillospiraceae bacterium]|nr:divalent-cation tolerance protein CutA [Oscillospiraceae bacterium]